MAQFSFNDLTPEIAELPAIKRERASGPNPFKDMLAASFADGKGRAVTIPAEHVADAQRLIRRAADSLNIGARIILDNGRKDFKCTPDVVKEWAEKKSQAKVKVMFEGKERRARKTKAKAEEQVETPGVSADAPTE